MLLLTHAECALSPRMAAARAAHLFAIAPNPSEQGQANDIAMWRRNWEERARKLIWC